MTFDTKNIRELHLTRILTSFSARNDRYVDAMWNLERWNQIKFGLKTEVKFLTRLLSFTQTAKASRFSTRITFPTFCSVGTPSQYIFRANYARYLVTYVA